MSPTRINRRHFLQSAAAAAAAAALPRLATAAAPRRIPVSIQLYSVRDDCARNFDATLEALAKLGFEGVEFAGYHGYAGRATDLRTKLDHLGLKAAATHIAAAEMRGDALNRTIEFHQEIGCRYLIVPHDADFTNPAKSDALADWFNATAEKLQPHGMACGYHNHKAEFEPSGDSNHWERFARRTRQEVVLQVDCGWASAAGQDCATLMKRHPGRMKVVHIKPTVFGDGSGKKAIFGQDSVNWPAVIDGCRNHGGTEWLTLEQEVYPDGKSPMECTALSLAAFRKVL